MLKKILLSVTVILTLTSCVSAGTSKDGDTPKWVDAYYDELSKSDLNPHLLLADLDSDGIPELLSVSYTNGIPVFTNGITYKNKKTAEFEIPPTSILKGTVDNPSGTAVWHTYYAPTAPHQYPIAQQVIRNIDFSDLKNPITKDTMDIVISDIFQDTAVGYDGRKMDAAVFMNGVPQEFVSNDKDFYIAWYESDADFGENTHLLPHLARWEWELNIVAQKVLAIDIREYSRTDPKTGLTILSYDGFKKAVMQYQNN